MDPCYRELELVLANAHGRVCVYVCARALGSVDCFVDPLAFLHPSATSLQTLLCNACTGTALHTEVAAGEAPCVREAMHIQHSGVRLRKGAVASLHIRPSRRADLLRHASTPPRVHMRTHTGGGGERRERWGERRGAAVDARAVRQKAHFGSPMTDARAVAVRSRGSPSDAPRASGPDAP